jgi:hypothetical protein
MQQPFSKLAVWILWSWVGFRELYVTSRLAYSPASQSESTSWTFSWVRMGSNTLRQLLAVFAVLCGWHRMQRSVAVVVAFCVISSV